MKQAILHFDKGDILLVELPEDEKHVNTHELDGITKIVFSSTIQDPLKCGEDMVRLSHKAELIGRLSELTEDQFDAIVDFEHLPPTDEEDERKFYRDYRYLEDDDAGQFSSSESFLSKMEAEGIKLTFIKEFYYDEDPLLFHSDRTFIFKILKP